MQSPEAYSKRIQAIFEKGGFSNFVSGKTKVRSKEVAKLDFDKPLETETWSCRHYVMIDGSTLAFTLGFGTTKRDAMTDLFGLMAQSFTVGRVSRKICEYPDAAADVTEAVARARSAPLPRALSRR